MSSAFDRSFKKLIGHEGGYTDNRQDPGNWTGGKVGAGKLLGTKYGIAANTYPNLDIKNLTLEQAKAIYRRDYWDKVRAGELPEVLAFQLFDMAVNHGCSRAVKILQEALGFTGRDVDGLIGPKTMAAARSANTAALVLDMLACRLQFYADLATWPTFGRGWARRVAGNLRAAADQLA